MALPPTGKKNAKDKRNRVLAKPVAPTKSAAVRRSEHSEERESLRVNATGSRVDGRHP
jgi:hypothetical protein